jgi:DNA topoisomerase-3
MLPPLNEGEIGKIASIELKEGATTALPRFSQGDLIKIMANAGHYCQNKEDFKNSELKLGTEATRANIVSTITSRYVKIHKNLVYLQPEGRILIEALGQDNYLTSVITTGRMERYLENIKNGKGTVEEFTKGIETVTKRVVEKLLADAPTWDFNKYIQEIQESEVIGKCKICGADVLEHTNFFGCSAYKENNCEFKIPKKILGKAISKENAVKLLKTGTTSLIKGFKPKDKDSTFDAFLVWSENNKSINFRYK